MDPEGQHEGEGKGGRRHGDDRPRADRGEHGRRQSADRVPDALGQGRHRVRRGHLVGRIREGREQRVVIRPPRRVGDARHHRHQVHHQRWSADPQGEGKHGRDDRLGQIPEPHDPLAREPVAETGRERGEQSGRHQAQDRHEPHRPRASLVEGVHEDRDPHRRLGHVEQQERELHPPDRPVPEHPVQRAQRRPEVGEQTIHARRTLREAWLRRAEVSPKRTAHARNAA